MIWLVVLEDHFLAVIPLLLELSFLLDIGGIGMAMLRRSAERAIGADILFREES